MPYLGTNKYSPEELKKEFYKLGLSFGVHAADDVTYIDASAVISEEEKSLSFFIVNRSEEENVNLSFDLHNLKVNKILDQQIINHENMYVSNTKDSPNEIIPKKTSIVSLQNDELSADIPALSYLFVRLELK